MTKSKISYCFGKHELTEIMAHFQECQAMVETELTEQDRLMVKQWLRSILLLHPTYSLRVDVIEKTMAPFHEDVIVRDYIADLSFLFFSTWGQIDGVTRLALNLMDGLTLDGQDASLSEIDETLRATMPTECLRVIGQELRPTWWRRLLGLHAKPPTLQAYLENNKVLLITYLLYLTNTLSTPAA